MAIEELDLGPIEERQLTLYRPAQSFYPISPTRDAVNDNAAKDVAALIMEVRRLRNVEVGLKDRIEHLENICEHYARP